MLTIIRTIAFFVIGYTIARAIRRDAEGQYKQAMNNLWAALSACLLIVAIS